MTQRKNAPPPSRPRNSEDTITVRTKMKPQEDLQVTWAELRDLQAQGLLAVDPTKKES